MVQKANKYASHTIYTTGDANLMTEIRMVTLHYSWQLHTGVKGAILYRWMDGWMDG